MEVERRGDVALILSNLDLDDIEDAVWEPYHREGTGRPPRNPRGIFKALIVKRLRQIPSERVNSRLEDLLFLDRPKVRGIRNITIHTALCIITMLLVAVAALRLGMPEKVRCNASFGW